MVMVDTEVSTMRKARQKSILQYYFEIKRFQLLHAERAKVERYDREIALLNDDASDVILSSIVTDMHGYAEAEARGGGMTSNPTDRAYNAYLREQARVSAEKKALIANRALAQENILAMEEVVRAVEGWILQTQEMYLGDLKVSEVIDRMRRKQTNEAIAVAAGYCDESCVRKWLRAVDVEIRRLLHFGDCLRSERERVVPMRCSSKRQSVQCVLTV